MSVATSLYADHANKKREEWLRALQEAQAAQDWAAVARIVDAISKFQFTE